MNPAQSPRHEYIEARRVLLDALTTLEPHIEAVILIGAQAVYLRTDDRLPNYQPYTTDADLVIDPARLADVPPLSQVLSEAGFKETNQPGRWKKQLKRPGCQGDIYVPVDLMVPSQIAPKKGRRRARLPGEHGDTVARKTTGVEGALLDYNHLEVPSLESEDNRRVVVKVAGTAALVVAKAHKLGDRLGDPNRLQSKDAGDMYLLFDATPVKDLVNKIRLLLMDKLSSKTAGQSLLYLDQLFRSPDSVGTKLAVDALKGVVDPSEVTSTITGYIHELLSLLRSSGSSGDMVSHR